MSSRIRAHINPLSITREHSFEGFSSSANIIVDVGACKGEFTQKLMQLSCNNNFVLFEIRIPLVKKLEQTFAGLPNVRIFDGDAGRSFRRIFEGEVQKGIVLETVYVNFPDPWFKAKHKKRRFITESFLASCAEFLDRRTEFVFQTDQEFLFTETLEVVCASEFSDVSFFEEPPFGVRTDWEEAKIKEGAKIFRMRFRKP